MNGAWRLQPDHSESLAPILVASGAPRLVSGLLARYMENDSLHFHHNKTEVTVQYRRRNVGLPIQLPSNFKYRVGEVTGVETPNGVQDCSVIDIEEEIKCHMIRHGPRKGEKVEDYFEMDEDGETMIHTMLHTSADGTETKVRRLYSKEDRR